MLSVSAFLVNLTSPTIHSARRKWRELGEGINLDVTEFIWLYFELEEKQWDPNTAVLLRMQAPLCVFCGMPRLISTLLARDMVPQWLILLQAHFLPSISSLLQLVCAQRTSLTTIVSSDASLQSLTLFTNFKDLLKYISLWKKYWFLICLWIV